MLQAALRRRGLLGAALLLPALLAMGSGPAAADALADIKSRGYFTFGLEAQYRPFEFRNEQNEIVGYDIDVANAFAKTLGVEARPVDTNWATVIQSLYSGQFDLILGGMTATAERYKRVDFSIPYMDASSGVLVKAGSGIAEVKDLAGKNVAAGAGTPQLKQLETVAGELGIAYAGDIKSFDDDNVAYQAMQQGRIDAYVSTLVSLSEFAKANPGFEIIPFKAPGLSAEWTAAAFRKEDAALREAFDAQIRSMKADGSLAALQEKWFGRSFVATLDDKAPAW